MSRVKINPGLASLIILASYLAGGATLLTITVLIFLFCEIDERVEITATRVVTFFIGITIVSLSWDLIVTGIGLVTGLISKLFISINGFLDYTDVIEYEKWLNPITNIVGLADATINFLLLFAKVTFVIAVLTNKPGSSNFITKKIDEYVAKALNFVSGIVPPQPAMAPQQPMPQQPMAPQQPVPQQQVPPQGPNNGVF